MPSTTLPDTFIVGAPTNPVLRQIAEDLLEETRAAALKAMAHLSSPGEFPLPQDPHADEHLFVTRFRSKPVERRAAAVTRAMATSELSSPDFRRSVSMAEHLRAGRPARQLQPESLNEQSDLMSVAPTSRVRGLIQETDPMNARVGGSELQRALQGGLKLPGLETDNIRVIKNLEVAKKPVIKITPKPKPKLKLDLPGPYDALALRLHRMHCVEETDGPGSDEIQLAGVAIGPSGASRKLGPTWVSNDFDSGEFIEFGLELDLNALKLIDHGPTSFATFDYDDDIVHVPNKGNKIVGWPRTYTVTFLLAEIDNGGFPDFVQQIVERLKDKAAQAIGAAIGAAIGGIAGSVIPGIGNVIGAAVGAIVGWVLGELWEFFVGLWEDDEFVPITVATTRQHQFHRFVDNGSDDSKDQVIWWKGHGGHYKLRFDWLVVE